VANRVVNYLYLPEVLGGTTRLRGYRTSAFVGPNLVVGNVVIRSRPLDILSVQVGAVAFYDVGDAFLDWDRSVLHHGAGAGLRFVFPQVERTVFRIDVGVPLGPPSAAAETTVVAQFRQAFPMSQVAPPTIIPQ
jgi:outer membrane translocation and assembly module TamA